MLDSKSPALRSFVGCLAVGLALAPLTKNVRAQQVEKSSHAELSGGPLHATIGTVALPADGLWTIVAPESEPSIRELYLVPKQPARLRQLGRRMYAALEENQLQAGRWQVQRGFEACRQFAQENGGVGPASISDFANDKRWKYLTTQWDSRSWRNSEIREFIDENPLKGPFIYLIPNTKFDFAPAEALEAGPNQSDASTETKRIRRVVKADKRVVLAFELRPFVDDGKHWVLSTDGTCTRAEIDPELLETHGVKVRPIVSKGYADRSSQPTAEYQVVLVADQVPAGPLKLEANNIVLNRETTIEWQPDTGKQGDLKEIAETVDRSRRFAWTPYVLTGNGGVLNVWQSAGEVNNADRNPRRNLSMFSILGGRAAVEETLQLQNLAVTTSSEAETVPIDSLKGVDVKSHPFEDMLDGQPGGQLDLARVAPADRFFLYVGKPEKLPTLLDSGAPFIASIGTSLTGNCLNYNLESRYLARLGMTRDWVDTVLASGLTSEMAIFAPDLFFIDGTDVTLVARLRSPQLLKRMLGMLGASGLSSESILELPTGDGNSAFLALRDDLLLMSTHRGELQLSLDLLQQDGVGSLGDSSEFRYMLTKLAVSEQTRLYAYFSDPFVRRLVGPHVKIGQRRRILAKAKMEALTARAMKARLDGQMPESLEDLIKTGYVPKSWKIDGMAVNSSGLVKSQHYGSLPRMESLPNLPLKNVTPAEAEAYRIYVENYSNYWRRFFDPIAVRLDDVGTDQLELSTFILPLVDNSIYNGLRTILAHQDDGIALSVPIVEPAPVVQFSMNLNETAWEQIAGNFSEFFRLYSGASPAMLDDFGPSAHVAIFDADPIVTWGSGDIFGAFGGQVMRGGGDSMLAIPVMLSMLTRPCSIMVETKAPERTRQYLRQAATNSLTPRRNGGFLSTAVSFYQVEDRDQWVWTMDIVGMVKLRYGIEVVGKYLVIRNIPWSSEDRVVSVDPVELNGATLQANPSACKEQLPGLFAAAADANRRAVMSGLARLYPFMLSGASSVDEAATLHQRLYGFYPKPLGTDQWEWSDFRMRSRDYGEPTNQRQPAFDPNEPFGLMNRIDSLQLNMQFEEDGLRSNIRWRLR